MREKEDGPKLTFKKKEPTIESIFSSAKKSKETKEEDVAGGDDYQWGAQKAPVNTDETPFEPKVEEPVTISRADMKEMKSKRAFKADAHKDDDKPKTYVPMGKHSTPAPAEKFSSIYDKVQAQTNKSSERDDAMRKLNALFKGKKGGEEEGDEKEESRK